jgi:uncharacterized protein (DUF488 family)
VPTRRAFTIGHSTHSLDELVALLAAHDVTTVADVRTVPRSRRTPHMTRSTLSLELPVRGLRYEHLPALGGWRRPRPDSPNDGWDNGAFRGYADHMDSAEFAAGLARLEALAAAAPTAAMCAEAVWWRCHRRLIADALVVRGWTVDHIGPDGRLTRHELTAFAEPDGERLSYPSAQLRLG